MGKHTIELTPAEIQSGHSRVQWAEGLILQLPPEHEGRNSWLLNYGVGEEAEQIRERWQERKGSQVSGSSGGDE